MIMRKLTIVVLAMFFATSLHAADGDLIVNGNMGLGTSTLNSRLTVSGTNASTTQGPHIWTYTTADAYTVFQQLNWGHNNVALTFDAYYDGAWKSSYAGSNYQIYKQSDQLKLRYASGVAAGGAITWGNGLLLGTSGNIGIGNTVSPTYKLYVEGVTYSTGGYQPSDIRLKENVEPIQSALDKVLKMEGVTYTWSQSDVAVKGLPEGKRYGVLAQNIETVMPEVVKEGPDGEKAIAYTEIIPVLIEAIKEQQKQIQQLTAEVERLKGGK